MSERCSGCNECKPCPPHEGACIHTKRIMDSCLDKDCIEDLRVYLTRQSQGVLDRSSGVKVCSADLLYVYIDVEPVIYKQGCYSVDLTFYYRIISNATVCNTRPETLCGLAVFNKRVILYGGSGCAKVFTSQTELCKLDHKTILSADVPEAVVEVVEPIVLAAKVADVCDCCRCDAALSDVPEGIRHCFDEDLVLSGEAKRLYVTLGQFSTIRLERDAQLRLPKLEYCIPNKECSDGGGSAEDPCDVFSKIDFPTDAFFPDNSNPGVCFDETTQQPCGH